MQPRFEIGSIIEQGKVCAVQFVSVRLNKVGTAKDNETLNSLTLEFSQDSNSFCRYGVEVRGTICYYFDHEITS